jgi:hypothetical protein
VKATVRCWPNGRVIPAVEVEFDAPPMVGDVIEIVDYVSLTVRQRRFAPDGHLVLRCDPEPGSDYGIDTLTEAFDEVR